MLILRIKLRIGDDNSCNTDICGMVQATYVYIGYSVIPPNMNIATKLRIVNNVYVT